MDSETVSDGTGTPVPGGLSEVEARELLEGLVQLPKVRCLEITEVNPTLDTNGNRMGEVAFRLLENSCKVIGKKKTGVTSA
jgi:arginase